MFGFREKAQPTVPAVAVLEEVPRGEVPTASEGLRAHVAKYQEVASRIGFAPGNLVQEQLPIFCADNQIPVYDADRVSDFLDRKAAKDKEAKGNWSWIPLRAGDMGKVTKATHNNNNEALYVGGISKNRHYHALVPMPILERVEKIQKAFPELHFFVSDIAPNMDPFICVLGVGLSLIVFGQWNEPGFDC